MRFDLKSPCANCPFRKEGAIDLQPGRVAGIVADLRKNDMQTFPCHKTTHGQAKQEQACAGASAFMFRDGNPSVALRAALAFRMVTVTQLKKLYSLLIDEAT
jgi:hypothetical protein